MNSGFVFARRIRYTSGQLSGCSAVGQRAAFGTQRSPVRIRPPRPDPLHLAPHPGAELSEAFGRAVRDDFFFRPGTGLKSSRIPSGPVKISAPPFELACT